MKKTLILSALVAIGIIWSATYADSLAQQIIDSVSQKSLNYQVNFINQVNDYLADEKISQDESKSAILNEIKNSVDIKTYTANGIVAEIKSLFTKEKASKELTSMSSWDRYNTWFSYDASWYVIFPNPNTWGNIWIRVINGSWYLAIPCLNLPKNAEWSTSDVMYLNYTGRDILTMLLLWEVLDPSRFSWNYYWSDTFLNGINGIYNTTLSTNQCSFICKKWYTYDSKANTCNQGLVVDESAKTNLSDIKAQTMTAMPIR